VTRATNAAVVATRRMAHHDLSVVATVSRHEELGELTRALEGLRQACADNQHASAEITQGSMDLSGRTENAALAEQSAAAAASLQDQAQRLNQRVLRFQLTPA
jgi:methyl-accepting chemotaxis protein